MNTLFDEHSPPQTPSTGAEQQASGRPLAVRVRPTSLEQFVGQEHLLGEGSALRTAIEQGRLHSMVLYGPPGSGKTTLARIVAARSQAAFEELSAVIGATTENPAFEVNGALLSRLRVYALKALSVQDVVRVLRNAAAELRNAATENAIDVDGEALTFLSSRSEGDARTALNALELAAATAAELGERRVSLQRASDALQKRAVLYDKRGDRHYDYISAWIKATRGSDPDASLYYLAVMLEGGEDPRFIVRRMVILASEDIGNADPQALVVATAAAAAVEHVGLPEAEFALAQCAIYLSLAPKSDATKRAVKAARGYIKSHGAQAPPGYLRSSTRTEGNYDYPHDRPGHVSPQELLPPAVAGASFYQPDDAEAVQRDRLEAIRKSRGR